MVPLRTSSVSTLCIPVPNHRHRVHLFRIVCVNRHDKDDVTEGGLETLGDVELRIDLTSGKDESFLFHSSADLQGVSLSLAADRYDGVLLREIASQ